MVLLLILAGLLLWLYTKGQSSGAAAGVSGANASPAGGGGTNAADYSPVSQFAQAVATYEGYYVPGSLAQRSNNPGNVGTFGGKVASYPDAQSGWDALTNWITGKASANPQWDFYDTMRYYLTGDTMGTPGPNQNPDAYAEYVANQLGVQPTDSVASTLGLN